MNAHTIDMDDMFRDIFVRNGGVDILRRICDECASLSRTAFVVDYQLYFTCLPSITERNYALDVLGLLTNTQQIYSNLHLPSRVPIRGVSPAIYRYKKIVPQLHGGKQQGTGSPVRLIGPSDGGIMYTLTEAHICRGTVPLTLSRDLLCACFKLLDAKQVTRCAYMCREWRTVVYQLGPYFLHMTPTTSVASGRCTEAWCTVVAYPAVVKRLVQTMHPVLVADMLTHASVMSPEAAGSADAYELAHRLASHLLLDDGEAGASDNDNDDGGES